MNTRIKLVRKALNLSQAIFGQKIGLKPSSLSGIERGTDPITERTIIGICLQYNVNENWLRTGKGEMFNFIDKKYDDFFAIFNNLNPILQDFLIQVTKDLLDTQNKL